MLEKMFDLQKIEEIQKQFINVKMDSFQNEMATSMAELMSKSIPLSKMALKGFIIFSFRDWQKKHNAFMADMNNPTVSLEEKFRITEEINAILLEKLTHVLKDPKDQDKLIEALKKKDDILRERLRKQQG